MFDFGDQENVGMVSSKGKGSRTVQFREKSKYLLPDHIP